MAEAMVDHVSIMALSMHGLMTSFKAAFTGPSMD